MRYDQIGYESACDEANEIIYGLKVDLYNQVEFADKQQTYIAELEEKVTLQKQWINESLNRSAFLEAENEQLQQDVQQSAELSKHNEEQFKRMYVEKHNFQEQIRRLTDENKRLSNNVHELQVRTRQAKGDRDVALRACTMLTQILNHSMLVASATFAVFEDELEAEADGRKFETRRSFERNYYERLEYATEKKLIHTLPERDPDLFKWAPSLSSVLSDVARRGYHYAYLNSDHRCIPDPFPDLVKGIIWKNGVLHPELLSQDDRTDENFV